MTDHELPTPHEFEEQIREASHALIGRTPVLGDHANLIHDALFTLLRLCQGHQWRTDDEQALQLLGVRLYNSGSAAYKLALAGYCQAALALTRDILELTNLLDLFLVEPARIAKWRTADGKGRDAFKPVKVREALEKHEAFKGQKRHLPYKRISTFASHANYVGFGLLLNGTGEVAVGPFLNEELLAGWLLETAAWLSEGTMSLARNLTGLSAELEAAKVDFAKLDRDWGERYLTA